MTAPAWPTLERGRTLPSFAPVTQELLDDHRVKDAALRLWCVLDRQAHGRPVAIDSLARLGEKLRRPNGDPASEDTIRRALQNLEETGWIDVHRTAGRVSRYVLHYRAADPAPDPSPDQVTPRRSAGGSRSATTPPADLRGDTRAVPSLREELKGEEPPPPPNPEPPTPTPTPTYVGRCPAHGNHPNPPNCVGCRAARIAHETTQAADRAAAPDLVKCPTHLVLHAPTAECRSCRADQLAGDQDEPLGRPQLGRAATEAAYRAMVGLQPSSVPGPGRGRAVGIPQLARTG